MAEGLRERKKRQARQHISDVATGLFLERGFDAVTIAEVAQAADVSVNTVYNYFHAKEDLFLDRAKGSAGRLSRFVRGREKGESAAAAVLRELQREVEAVSPAVGLIEGFDRFLQVIEESSGLKARIAHMQQKTLELLEETLREETGADARDTLPALVAGQIGWVHSSLLAFISREVITGRRLAEVSRDALGLLDEMEELLSEKVLNYAVRDA
ncbi:TetR/AcrR family transcriptional regulator [Streptomyces sp. NBC_01465]|uniref:TetR/AcrR family transcriptional regulator n=1 Tax=Streptomyces sp. NBC_01465 TaxID=2903878 RepID=UPI002E2F0F96|nr:helix-turn-helix domain-containing protein [Streptomyces sp. NBC_01465]